MTYVCVFQISNVIDQIHLYNLSFAAIHLCVTQCCLLQHTVIPTHPHIHTPPHPTPHLSCCPPRTMPMHMHFHIQVWVQRFRSGVARGEQEGGGAETPLCSPGYATAYIAHTTLGDNIAL